MDAQRFERFCELLDDRLLDLATQPDAPVTVLVYHFFKKHRWLPYLNDVYSRVVGGAIQAAMDDAGFIGSERQEVKDRLSLSEEFDP